MSAPFLPDTLPLETLSALLWAGFGITIARRTAAALRLRPKRNEAASR